LLTPPTTTGIGLRSISRKTSACRGFQHTGNYCIISTRPSGK
jgi:hypothetical protein